MDPMFDIPTTGDIEEVVINSDVVDNGAPLRWSVHAKRSRGVEQGRIITRKVCAAGWLKGYQSAHIQKGRFAPLVILINKLSDSMAASVCNRAPCSATSDIVVFHT